MSGGGAFILKTVATICVTNVCLRNYWRERKNVHSWIPTGKKKSCHHINSTTEYIDIACYSKNAALFGCWFGLVNRLSENGDYTSIVEVFPN